MSKKNSKSSYQKNNIYMKNILTHKIIIPILYINDNLSKTLKQILVSEVEGKCINEGYIKINSCNIISYSSGILEGSNVRFEVLYECLLSNPVEGMIINCKISNITKAGIRAQIDEEISPMVIFVAKDHHYLSESFNSLEEGNLINVKIIGQKYELNDKYISVIAELIEEKLKSSDKQTQKQLTKQEVDKQQAEQEVDEQEVDEQEAEQEVDEQEAEQKVDEQEAEQEAEQKADEQEQEEVEQEVEQEEEEEVEQEVEQEEEEEVEQQEEEQEQEEE